MESLFNKKRRWLKTGKSMGLANRGKKKPPRSEEHRKNLSLAKKGKKLNLSDVQRQAIRDRMTGKNSPIYGKFGALAPNWKGGRTTLNKIIRESSKYYEWRASVFKRDKYLCQFCFSNCDDLNADHIKPFALILIENHIDTIEKALTCKDLWNLSNGRTLCHECHRKTDTYGKNIYIYEA